MWWKKYKEPLRFSPFFRHALNFPEASQLPGSWNEEGPRGRDLKSRLRAALLLNS